MKRLIVTLFILISIKAGLMAQAKLTTDVKTVELGQVVWNTPVVIDFNVTNTGKDPLHIVDVMSSCGCSVPKWSDAPIGPGESSIISVEFDAKSLGSFYKELSVYSNSEPGLIYLSFTGEVVRKITNFTSSHPIKIGGVRLSKDALDFGEVVAGDSKVVTINYVSESDGAYKPILMHTPSFISVKSTEESVRKGDAGSFEVTLNTENYKEYGLVNSEVYLSRFVGDKVGKENRIPIIFTVVPKIDAVSFNPPSIRLNDSNLNLAAKLENKHKASGYVLVENNSDQVLKILKIQTFSPAVRVKLTKNFIERDSSARLRIYVDKNKRLSPNDDLSVLLITNDPQNSVIRLNK